MAVSRSKISTIVRAKMTAAGIRLAFRLGSCLTPVRAAGKASQLFRTPMRSSRTRARHASRHGATELDIPVDDHHIHAYAWGDPTQQPYVLFSHGWSSHGTRIAAWLTPLRRAGYAVVAFDQYAHGLSPGDDASIPTFVDHLLAVGGHFGPALAIVGHSLGGAATMLALQRGLQARRIILIAPAADPVDATRRFADMIGLAHHACKRMIHGFERRYGINFARMQAHDVVPHLAHPALIVHDLADREVPWCEGERYARHWPGARLLSTQDLGHHRIMDDPSVIDAGIGFIQGEVVGERIVSSPNLPYGLA